MDLSAYQVALAYPSNLPQMQAARAAQLQAAGLQPPALSRPGPPGQAGAPGDDTAPWKQRWQDYLQQQAAYRQQLTQQMHGLGPYANQLTLGQIQQAVDARRSQVMQAMLGAGPGVFRGPGQ